MLMDKENTFSEAQSLALVQGTYESTYVLDMSPAGVATAGTPPQIPPGELVRVFWKIGTAVTAAGATTVNVQLVAAEDTGLSTNPVTIIESGALAKTVLVADYSQVWILPLKPLITKRYLGFNYVVGGADADAGTGTIELASIIWDWDTLVNGAWTGIAANTGF